MGIQDFDNEERIVKKEKTKLNLKFNFWIIFAIFWTLLILGGIYYLYENHFNLNRIITVNVYNSYNFTIPLNNSNTNINNIDPPTTNNSFTIINQINNTYGNQS